jgi:hypothetical protein
MEDSNNSFDQILSENPLINYSVYTNSQVKLLIKLEENINKMIPNGKDGQILNDIYGSFWLWTLGAYEVVRTMVQAKSCFTPEVHRRLMCYKRKIAKIRIPFTKQEFQGKNKPIFNEASMSGMNIKTGNMFFTIDKVKYSSKALMKEFHKLMKSIASSDITQSHKDSYM